MMKLTNAELMAVIRTRFTHLETCSDNVTIQHLEAIVTAFSDTLPPGNTPGEKPEPIADDPSSLAAALRFGPESWAMVTAVRLLKHGEEKTRVLEIVRAHTGFNPVDVQSLVNDLRFEPHTFKSTSPLSSLEALAKDLDAAGATVEIVI